MGVPPNHILRLQGAVACLSVDVCWDPPSTWKLFIKWLALFINCLALFIKCLTLFINFLTLFISYLTLLIDYLNIFINLSTKYDVIYQMRRTF